MFFKGSKKAAPAALPLRLDRAPSPGFFAGLRIGTRYAWTDVLALSEGDAVLTAQDGEQEITDVRQGIFSVSHTAAAARHWPIEIPAEAFGNEEVAMLAPSTRIVVSGEIAIMLFDTPQVSIRADDLVGFRGIKRARWANGLRHVTLCFQKPHTLIAEGGLFIDLPGRGGVFQATPLDGRQSRLLLRHLNEAPKAVRPAKPEISWI
ncbi:Hint domain-containing protein [Litoreibacter roseus]|uniref:Hedgehog/Intein (Hint) domain-containing protein n=1 Tax=Litoreibacter roseus TaxID=2601869 RepID=A0A6N6JHN6_9RHOB|nr:Hint domain-containing protein [Litoreibacter roseus]GFE65447.1 hypothetical protein KIN_25210 [Litoreibacter roseus]